MRQLTCPECHSKFTSLTLEDGRACCPKCRHPMFTYREPGEHMTPKEFTALLETRGKAAGLEAMRWFPNMKRVAQAFAAGQLIMWMWPFLAKTFVVEDVVDGS